MHTHTHARPHLQNSVHMKPKKEDEKCFGIFFFACPVCSSFLRSSDLNGREKQTRSLRTTGRRKGHSSHGLPAKEKNQALLFHEHAARETGETWCGVVGNDVGITHTHTHRHTTVDHLCDRRSRLPLWSRPTNHHDGLFRNTASTSTTTEATAFWSRPQQQQHHHGHSQKQRQRLCSKVQQTVQHVELLERSL